MTIESNESSIWKNNEGRTLVVMLVGGLLGVLISAVLPSPTPEEAFKEFLVLETKESHLMGPLCAAGKNVVPIVIERIKDRELEKRRYAISFLGSDDYPEALPVLRQILEDESELDVYRGDALSAVFLLDKKSGTKYASRYGERTNHLGMISNELLNIKNYEEYRKREQREKCFPSD